MNHGLPPRGGGSSHLQEPSSWIIEGTTGTKELALWEYGKHYIHNQGGSSMGESIDDRPRPAALLNGTGKLFTRLRPQYENLTATSFLIATDEGCFNNGTGDNTDAVNAFLKKALDAKQVAYFPAGIYSVQGTVTFPAGSKIQRSGWSQIQATGSYISDMANPQVAVRVGELGDVGTMEIADILFTTKGATAGAIMMEWNLHESTQGAAARWDSHIRIGLVAYWRELKGIQNGWDEELKKPANVKKLLFWMQRSIDIQNLAPGLDKSKVDVKDLGRTDPPYVPFIWSGAFAGENCLMNPQVHPHCPDDSKLRDLAPFGAGCDQYTSGTCVVSASYSPPTNTPDRITFQTGPANITCTPGSPGCGFLCTGYYCGSTASSN